MESDAPFAETFKAIQAELGLSQREIARRCEKNGWGTHAAISQMVRGTLKPSMNALAEIAKALEVRPETFAEYRLGAAREMLDPDRAGGLDQALANLRLFKGQPVAGEVPEHPPSTQPGRRRGGRAGRAASS
jgi:transcriptional regulator with XRE-family HTH domain